MPDNQPKYLAVKNWEKFQHYKKRNPPWIKLHRCIFDDYEFQSLPNAVQLDLIKVWTLAASDSGSVPTDIRLLKRLCKLDHLPNTKLMIEKGFLIPVASKPLATCQQNSILETETEVEREKDIPPKPPKGGNGFHISYPIEFDFIWKTYPRKDGKGAAWKAFQKINPTKEESRVIAKSILEHKRSDDWLKDNGQFVPHLSTYLNQRRWEDEEDG